MERNRELPSQKNLKTKQDLAQIPKQKAGSTKARAKKHSSYNPLSHLKENMVFPFIS